MKKNATFEATQALDFPEFDLDEGELQEDDSEIDTDSEGAQSVPPNRCITKKNTLGYTLGVLNYVLIQCPER